MAEKRTDVVTFKQNPMTLVGPDIAVGSPAPDFKVVDEALQPVTRDSARGKVQLIAVVPSIDTGGCDTLTRKVNKEAAALPDQVGFTGHGIAPPGIDRRNYGDKLNL